MDFLFAIAPRTTVSWWDLVDIAIVALAIYEFLKLIRGTRAAQMAFGLSLIVALYFFSQWAPLQTVNWLIRNAVGYVVFAAVVIFQSDIRRALAHFGRTPFFRRFARTETTDEIVEEVVEAVTVLAERKTGAIIAIEREIGLRDYVESGIPLDARITYDLLISIFQLDSPLHDGAVVIQEDRMAAAACFLPLTVNPHLSRGLGTRHRAGIGLTEESDAIVVIVSEETGQISLARDGQIELRLTAEQLRSRLTSLMARRRLGADRRQDALQTPAAQ